MVSFWVMPRLLWYLIFAGLAGINSLMASDLSKYDSLTGSKVNIKSDWVGRLEVDSSLSIFIMAGHADSQGIEGSGTAGEAVDLNGEDPMNPFMSDELFWNLKLRDEIVKIGKLQGLNISAYEPGRRRIINENDPATNWSFGALQAEAGGYVLEIHFDSYGEYGFGSGLIPAISLEQNLIDESLAKTFGRYPMFFRGGLGAPRRGIRVLEIGKLGGSLEAKLRNPQTREKTLNIIALRIVGAIKDGFKVR